MCLMGLDFIQGFENVIKTNSVNVAQFIHVYFTYTVELMNFFSVRKEYVCFITFIIFPV